MLSQSFYLLLLTTIAFSQFVHRGDQGGYFEIDSSDQSQLIVKRDVSIETKLMQTPKSQAQPKEEPKSDLELNLPVNDKLSSIFFLNDSHEHLLIKWVGSGSSVLICLAKYRNTRYTNKNPDQIRNLTSNLYISYDYGTTFVKIDKLKLNETNRDPLISNFFISEVLHNHFIFTDIVNNYIFTTQDLGHTFTSVKMKFSPKLMQLHPTMSQLVLASDDNNTNDEQLYFSNDFGSHWDVIADNVKQFSWDKWNGHRLRIFAQKRRPNGHFDLISSDNFFRKDQQIWLTNINRFTIANQYLLVTRNLSLLGTDSKEKHFELWVSCNRNPLQKAIFDQIKPNVRITDFYVADSTDDELFLAVRFNDSTTDLYVSNQNGNQFQLSLQNLVTGTKNAVSGVNGNKISTVDFHRVAGLKGIYIANVNQDASRRSDLLSVRSLISFDKGTTWLPLNVPTKDLNGNNYNCKPNCSLYLIQNDMLSPFKYQPIMSKESAVGTILAAGIVQGQKETFGLTPNLFISRDAGVSWREVFDGRHIFNMGDHGGLIVAVKHYSKSNVTDRLEYSLDEGETWRTLRFINQSIKVYNVLTESGEKTSTFTIFGALNADKHRWVLVKVNLTSLIDQPCVHSRDYEFWSPTRPNSKCLMGRQEMHFRRKAGAHCLNGEDFEGKKLKIIQNCNCTRDDYECDFGYQTTGESSMCLPEPSASQYLDFDCEPGKPFTISQGYRKVQGNTCVDSEPNLYSPVTKMCPAATAQDGKQRSVFKAIFLSLICTSLIFLGVFGAMFYLRSRRTQSNLFFLTNTHYNTRSDSAILLDADELENDDGPIIRGFSDEVPMVVA